MCQSQHLRQYSADASKTLSAGLSYRKISQAMLRSTSNAHSPYCLKEAHGGAAVYGVTVWPCRLRVRSPRLSTHILKAIRSTNLTSIDIRLSRHFIKNSTAATRDYKPRSVRARYPARKLLQRLTRRLCPR